MSQITYADKEADDGSHASNMKWRAQDANEVKDVVNTNAEALDGKQPLNAALTSISGLTPSNGDVLYREAGAWVNKTIAQLKTILGLTKSDVGLGNVDNTSDANKPVSTAQQTALDLKQSLDEKGVANGYASLDATGKVPASELPEAILGTLKFKGTWNANTNVITSTDLGINGDPMPAAGSGNEGWYFIVATSGTTSVDGISDWIIGDWILSSGVAWVKIDNTDLVVSVAGKTGVVTLVKGDVGLGNVDNTSDANKPVSTAQQTALDAKAFNPAVYSSGTDIRMNRATGNYYFFAAASADVVFTFSNVILGGFSVCLINAPTEPAVTSGTLIPGSTFVPSTDMLMVLHSFDGINVVYYFLALS